MDRDIGTTLEPITLVSAFGHSILATQRHARLLAICAVLEEHWVLWDT